MVAVKDGQSQVIKLSLAAFAGVNLSFKLRLILTLMCNVITFAVGANDALRPAELPYAFVVLGVIEEIMQLHREAVLHQSNGVYSRGNSNEGSFPESLPESLKDYILIY